MSKPAFIVDGFTEMRIVQSLCPNRPVQRLDLNGKDVKISAIAKKIASQIKIFSNRYYPIIVLIDKEQRSTSFDKIVEELRAELVSLSVSHIDIRIGVADRMIENWIVADWEQLCINAQGAKHEKPNETDGINGKAKIQKVLGNYNKLSDGVRLFLEACPEKIYKNSASFKYFVDQLRDISCSHFKKL